METTEYYIQSLDLTLDPNVDEIDVGGASLNFEVKGDPQYQDSSRLCCEFEIEMDLLAYSEDSDLGSGDKKGDVTVEFMAVVRGDEEEFEPYLETWREENYQSVSSEFRHHIESGILTDILSPVSELVNNSFRGVLPNISFTRLEPVPIEDLDEEKQQNLASSIEDTVTEIIGEVYEGKGEELVHLVDVEFNEGSNLYVEVEVESESEADDRIDRVRELISERIDQILESNSDPISLSSTTIGLKEIKIEEE